jgi:hypothetical protein
VKLIIDIYIIDMNFSNIKTPLSISNSPTAQKGGKGRHHKRNCKCRLCKRGGDGDDESPNLDDMEKGTSSDSKISDSNFDELDKMEKGPEVFANEGDYEDLDKMEQGLSSSLQNKSGGTRKHRKHHKRTNKRSKSKRRHTRGKKHGRKSHRARRH